MLQLGPIAFATDRLIAVALIIVFVVAMDRIIARSQVTNTRATGAALFVGIITARLAFVIEHYNSFSRDWSSAFAIWQGGFSASAGFIAAAAIIAWRLRPMATMIKGQLLLAILAIAWFASAALLRPEPQPLPELPPLAQMDGSSFDFQKLEGRPYVINLWATWCPPCRRELPMLSEAAEESNVSILLVNQGEASEIVQKYLNENNVAAGAILIDNSSVLSQRLKSSALPFTIFVDASGRIVETHVGEISRAELFAQISKIDRK